MSGIILAFTIKSGKAVSVDEQFRFLMRPG